MMKLCRTCRYGNEYELDKPCIVYREDCPLYEKEGDEMNREEAIEVIKQDIPCEYDTDLIEALEMAIKALEQEPSCPFYKIDDDGHGLCMNHSEQKYCQDCKHNDDFDNDICLECEYDGHTRGMTRYELQEPCGETVSLEAFKQVMWERDIAIEQLKELGYGFGQKIEPCDDAISRQAVLYLLEDTNNGWIINEVSQLPPVNPQEPKTGHWNEVFNDIEGEVRFYCSECNDYQMFTSRYCPNCGAKMFEPQESEDKCKNCEYYHNPDYTRCHKCKAESEVTDADSD